MPLSIAHYVSLSGFGGVEQQFAQFAATAAQRSNLHQMVVACSRRIHPHHKMTLSRLQFMGREKCMAGFSVPRRPPAFRRARYRWLARRMAPDVALLWNRLGQQNRVLDALGARRCLYWEHGSAWLAGEETEKRCALKRLPAAICNSHAARRMLQLRWGYEGATRICLNGLRPNAVATDVQSKTLPADRPLHIGVASRLVPIKATCIAIHALAAVRNRGIDARLRVAGDGPERSSLRHLVRELGLDDAVAFEGVMQDMGAFYANVDVLLHPALREPFGVVAAEAGAHGCPVVCTAVDGLPEVVDHGTSGLCIPATLSLQDYETMGGATAGLPPYVYAPDEDAIREPRVCDPAALADAISELVADPAHYARMSQATIRRVSERFDFNRHVDDVLAAAREYAETGTLSTRGASA